MPPGRSQAFFDKAASKDKTFALSVGGFYSPFADNNFQEARQTRHIGWISTRRAQGAS